MSNQTSETPNWDKITEGKVRHGLKLGPDDATPLGTVLNYMYVTKKEQETKYKVFFKGYGKDGCLESELERIDL